MTDIQYIAPGILPFYSVWEYLRGIDTRNTLKAQRIIQKDTFKQQRELDEIELRIDHYTELYISLK